MSTDYEGTWTLSNEDQLKIAEIGCVAFAFVAVGYLWGISVAMLILDNHAPAPDGWPSILYQRMKYTGKLMFAGGSVCSVVALYLQRR